VRGWAERWRGSRTGDVPEMDALAAWLVERLPPDPARASLVHGDFKLDNVMLDPEDVGRVVAVFDWEMSAVGDALVDLGIMLAYWAHTPSEEARDAVGGVTHRPGWFTRDEILERYAARTGRDLSGVAFYEVFALFKLAVVVQQIFYRYQRGQTDDPRFASLDRRVAWLARLASDLAGRA
jgi:aminoglycoside phosphotransferase (APT) family kinase protein